MFGTIRRAVLQNPSRVFTALQAQCGRVMSGMSTDSVPFDEEAGDFKERRQERGLNRVQLIGRIGRDPEHRGTDEHPCIVFPLATNLSFRKASTGELMSKTDWHRICVFRPGLRDNVASRIAKGDRVMVEGSLSYQRYTDSDRPVNITSILADDIMILARRRNQEQEGDDV
ncbi:single-stranded DNA-binding protein, mitochondrial [Aplysia californica]|uniref:Single-stranded DNA-binding protein, mitochondrial n=1 Tax=Aplysia californica TaxID=6500 RepID=A0ABM0K8P6_APLCA|nr:single-stranded DNA-binding protein, mitochondrial [Aplysia californica]